MHQTHTNIITSNSFGSKESKCHTSLAKNAFALKIPYKHHLHHITIQMHSLQTSPIQKTHAMKVTYSKQKKHKHEQQKLKINTPRILKGYKIIGLPPNKRLYFLSPARLIQAFLDQP